MTKARYILGLAVVLTGALAATVWAADPSHVNISQGYRATEPTVAGSLVMFDRGSVDSVKLASVDRSEDLVGVVVQANESLLSVTSSLSQVQVATSGIATALVSNINGDVKRGDRIAASPIRGVGMKTENSTRVLGIAQADLSASTDKEHVEATDLNGKKQSVTMGRVPVLVDISYYNVQTTSVDKYIPPVVRDLSSNIAGKEVSPIRILVSFVLLALALVVSIVMVYGAVRSSIVSIGRNPLSKSAVRGSVLQVLIFVIIVLLVTLISVYFILTR
jgi:hypothetical protein